MINIPLIKKTVTEINDKVIELCKECTDSFKNELIIMEAYPEFYDEHPFLVKKICKQDDLTILYKMLDSLELVNNGSDTISNVEHKLGEELANKYLPK